MATWWKRTHNTARIVALSALDRRVPYASTETLQRIQNLRLRSTIQHAYKTVPFWRRAMEERGITPRDIRSVGDLEKLPIIDGETVVDNSQAFLSTEFPKMNYIALHSSGSQSAVRRAIYWDEKSALEGLAYGERDRRVLRSYLGDTREAWMSPRVSMLRESSSAIAMADFRRNLVLLPKKALATHMLPPDQPIEHIVDEMNRIQPAVVFSYGSHAEYFFRYILDRDLSVSLPRVWVYGSDMLTDAARELIEREFGCPMHSTYQSVEAGRLGFTCEQRKGFHLNTDLCAVRIVDDQGRTVAPGEIGEVVISNLRNRAMVLLNYRLGDIATISRDPCPCGRSLPLLRSLLGRRGTILRMQDGRAVSDLVFSEHCSDTLERVLFWQVVQETSSRLRWRIVPRSSVNRNELKRKLVASSRDLAGSEVDVLVEFLNAFPIPPSGKTARVVSLGHSSQ